MTMRISIESWDPEYGASLPTGELEPSTAEVDPGVEYPAAEWRPLDPDPGLAPVKRVAFVDGVRRIEALAWLHDQQTTQMGLCASWAAGAVLAAERAQLVTAEVRRGLFSAADLTPLETSVGRWEPRAVAASNSEQLVRGLQQRMGELEQQVAAGLDDDHELLVVDGPLRLHHERPGAVGFVKTHQVSYLPQELAATVARLQAGQRTPLFLTTASWSRFSCYLRLPGPLSHPWAGVVRLELSADLPLAEARELAGRACLTLPRFASEPHKDPRAPQNLYPIAGLEQALRQRLGDATLVRRALRAACAG